MNSRRGGVNPELLLTTLFISLIVALIFGGWTLRVMVITIAGLIFVWAFWPDRKMRFRPGDRVRVKAGKFIGECGVVVKPLKDGWGAQIKLERGYQLEDMDFPAGDELEKLS